MRETENCPESGDGRSEPILSAPGIRYHLDASGIVRTTLSGTITANDLIAHSLARAAAGHLPRRQIVDARGARLALSTEDVKRIAALSKELRQRGPVGSTAFVAFDDLAFGMARMFSAYIADGTFEVFRTIPEAEAWHWAVRD